MQWQSRLNGIAPVDTPMYLPMSVPRYKRAFACSIGAPAFLRGRAIFAISRIENRVWIAKLSERHMLDSSFV